ncbi:MAG TPA: signal peptide peptidase SppA [Ghiorsea sp.]|nr:signal peptide peptidase SppA [Ghiorsea sp.]
MKEFFSKLMRGIEGTRNVMLNMFFLFFIGFLIYTLMSAQPSLPERVVLQLNLDGALVEQVQRPTIGLSSLTSPAPKQVKVHDVVTALKRAAKDEAVLGVRLDLQNLTKAALPHLQQLKKAVETFKESGKPVMAYADSWSQAQYYLAASADEVYLHPMGMIALNGYGLYRNYIKEALDKLDIEVHVFRAGKYKSAAAPFIHTSMGEDERQANKVWLDTLWGVYTDDLFDMRGIEPARLQYVLDHPAQAIADASGDIGQLFLAEHWVDDLLYAEQANATLMAKTGEAELVGYKAYLTATGSGFLPNQPQAEDNWIGIVMGSGQILSGEQPPGTIGSDTMVEQLQIALEDERIKAVVLRLNTPGGSALASESIRHAVEVLREHGKPVVVSMGSMAASGGYWIASAADEIWASPATLTGSIGVFGIVPNISKGLQKLGIQTDGLGTSKIAGGLRLDKSLSPELADSIQLSIHHIYQQFTKHVAQGRGMSMSEVEQLAQGRVWSGQDALELGLVDALGDIDDAIKAAAQLANIEANHEPVEILPETNPLELLLDNLLSEAAVKLAPERSSILENIMLQMQQRFSQILLWNDPRGVYALSGVELVQ